MRPILWGWVLDPVENQDGDKPFCSFVPATGQPLRVDFEGRTLWMTFGADGGSNIVPCWQPGGPSVAFEYGTKKARSHA